MSGQVSLSRSADFAKVYNQGKSRANELFIMKFAPNGLRVSRYGLTVSRRVGKAVTRNHIKRLFREILRILPLRPGWDMVFIVRPAAAAISYSNLKPEITRELSHTKILGLPSEKSQ